jgi:hypothetical protein
MQPRGWRLASPSSVPDSYSARDSPPLYTSTMAEGRSKPINIPRKSPLVPLDDASHYRPYFSYGQEQSAVDVDSPILRPASPPQKASSRTSYPLFSVEDHMSFSPRRKVQTGKRHYYNDNIPSSDTLPVTFIKRLRLGDRYNSDSDVSELDLGSALAGSDCRDEGVAKDDCQDYTTNLYHSPLYSKAKSGNTFNLPVSSSLSVTPLLLQRHQSESDTNSSITYLPNVETAMFPLEYDDI